MAVTIAAAALATAIDDTATLAARLLPVCSAAVTQYAPAAPDEVADEAVIRMAAYLASPIDRGRAGSTNQRASIRCVPRTWQCATAVRR